MKEAVMNKGVTAHAITSTIIMAILSQNPTLAIVRPSRFRLLGDVVAKIRDVIPRIKPSEPSDIPSDCSGVPIEPPLMFLDTTTVANPNNVATAAVQ